MFSCHLSAQVTVRVGASSVSAQVTVRVGVSSLSAQVTVRVGVSSLSAQVTARVGVSSLLLRCFAAPFPVPFRLAGPVVCQPPLRAVFYGLLSGEAGPRQSRNLPARQTTELMATPGPQLNIEPEIPARLPEERERVALESFVEKCCVRGR